MLSLTCFKFRFTPHWAITLLAVFFISLLSYLGFWQIHRADEKTSMLKTQAAQALQEPKIWQGKSTPVQYQRIKAKGKFLKKVFLLDNQHYQHRFGYNLISPLLLDNGQILMVDRGWVLGDPARLSLPEISTPEKRVLLEGSVYYPSSKQWVLGLNLEKKNDNLFIIESFDPKIISSVLQKKLYPFIMRLSKGHPYGFVCEWNVVSMPPQRHLAYAFQWFAMALAVLILFVSLNIKRTDEKICEK